MLRNNRNVIILRSNPVHPDPRVEKIAHALTGYGYSVQVLGWDRTARLERNETRGDYIIHRLPIQASFGSGIGNLPQLIRWQMGLVRWLVAHGCEFDVIHACDFDTILPALMCKAIRRKAVVYDIFDFYADHLRRTPGWIKKLIRGVDLWAISKADAVILVDEARKQQIAGAKPKRLEIIYNSPEKSSDYPVPENDRHIKLRIAYIGLLQKERGLIEILNVVSRHPQWHLDLAGFGGDEDEIFKAASKFSNIHWYGRVDYQKALGLSAAADLLFATYDPIIPNHRYSSPNKVFEAMMLGKPILVAKDTNMDLLIQKADCGMVVRYGREDDLESALMDLAENPEERNRLGRNARLAYHSFFSWDIMRERLLKLYDSVLSNRPGISGVSK